jgi:hypothetical protein
LIDVRAVLALFIRSKVEFIVVGGVAATMHGSVRMTQDLDVVYARSDVNLVRLEKALAPHRPYPRGAPPGLPFSWSAETLRRGLNFTLDTTFGELDLLGEIVGGGGYADLRGHTVELEAYGLRFLCLDLDTLIRVKKAAGRPRDFDAIAELLVIRDVAGSSGRP